MRSFIRFNILLLWGTVCSTSFSKRNNHPFQLFVDMLATHIYSGLLTVLFFNSLRIRCAVVTSDTSQKRGKDPRVTDLGPMRTEYLVGWNVLDVVAKNEDIVLARCWVSSFSPVVCRFSGGCLNVSDSQLLPPTGREETGRWRAKFNRYKLLQASAAI
jgi:hypothetical protein